MKRWLVAVVLFGCGSSKREPPPAVPVVVVDAAPVVVADAAPVVVAPDADPYAGYPERLARPTTPCMLEGAWSHQPRGLAFTAGGKPYADVFQVKHARAHFGAGVFVEVETESMRLAGFTDAKQIVLHANKPFTIADYAAPGPRITLRYTGAHDDKLAFDVPLPSFLKPKSPLRGERPCGDLSLSPDGEFDPREAIDAGTERTSYLPEKKSIPLSIEAGKPAVATLRFDLITKVDVLESTPKLTRVVVHSTSLDPAQQLAVFGWVSSKLLTTTNTGYGGSWGSAGDRMATRPPPVKDAKRMTCRDEIPLAVEVGGTRKTVGALRANIEIDVLPGDDFVEVRPVKPHAELVQGGRWLVNQAALAACR